MIDVARNQERKTKILQFTSSGKFPAQNEEIVEL
jgi:hypothetical protein